MKNKQLVFGLILGILLVGVLGTFWWNRPVHAKKTSSVRIAIVDGARIKNESKAFLKVMDLEKQTLEALNKQIREKYQVLQAKLKKSKNPNIPAKERAKYKKQFDEEFAIWEPKMQKEKAAWRRRQVVLTDRFNEAVIQVTRELAKKHNVDLLLNATVLLGVDIMTVFYVSPKIDLTNEAIALLDQQIDEITK